MRSPLQDPSYRRFVSHVAALREAAGVSQLQLAKRLGKPASYVWKTENFERRMDPSEFAAWTRALGADPATEYARASQSLPGDAE